MGRFPFDYVYFDAALMPQIKCSPAAGDAVRVLDKSPYPEVFPAAMASTEQRWRW